MKKNFANIAQNAPIISATGVINIVEEKNIRKKVTYATEAAITNRTSS
jgi:hypothetical protein